MWTTTKTVKKGSYLYGVCKQHPDASKHGYVLMHRLVMENKLNRLLTKDEVVHHINGDKKDNRPDNLQVMAAAEHSAHHAADRPRKTLDLVCHWCGKHFKRFANRTGKRSRHFCSRSCNGKHSRSLQLSTKEQYHD